MRQGQTMTTMTINTSRPPCFHDQSVRPELWQQALLGHTSRIVLDLHLEQVPGVMGRLVLALVPFSLLSWMFIAG